MSVNQTETPPAATLTMPAGQLRELAQAAATASGATAEVAGSLADATVAAELHGKSEVGTAHLVDYLDAMARGVLNGTPNVATRADFASVITADADRGPAQYAFDQAAGALQAAARQTGVAVLSVHNGYTAGELGYYTTRLARRGLVALACANSPALMSVYGSKQALTGTNPLSFALPAPDGNAPRMFDQAASATAWVKVRDAAAAGERLPAGFVIDAKGNPTREAAAGLAGALLPFGGAKASNIALMIEALASLSGGSYSREASSFDDGDESPRVGLFVVALDPDAFGPGYAERAEAYWQGLAREHGVDFGRRHPDTGQVQVADDVIGRLRELAGERG